MTLDVAIRGSTLVDGTGAPRRCATAVAPGTVQTRRTRLIPAVGLGVFLGLSACGSDTAATEAERRPPVPENQRTASAPTTTTPAPSPVPTTMPPPVPPDPAAFGCSAPSDGTIECATQEAYTLFVEAMNDYNRSLALWEEQQGGQNLPEPDLDDAYPNDDAAYDEEPYIDEPVDPYGFDEGPWP